MADAPAADAAGRDGPSPDAAPDAAPDGGAGEETLTLQARDGWDSKAQETMSQAETLPLVQQSDNNRFSIDARFYASLHFQPTVPTSATVISVTVFVEHHEETDFRGPLDWEVGVGPLANPMPILGRTTATPLIDPSGERLAQWDVTSLVSTATHVNDLKFVVRNRDPGKKTLIDYVYVRVTFRP